MIVELDCGNSFIKWRIVNGAEPVICSMGIAASNEELISDLGEVGWTVSLRRGRLVSVRSDEETAHLRELLVQNLGIEVQCAQPARALAGVRNGYEDFSALGLDRWLAMVGAYTLAQRACLVIDLGTAVTSDFVSADGEHRGGYICPGLPLLRSQLRGHTRRIRYDDAVVKEMIKDMGPGRATAQAVERGCLLMLRGFVDAQLTLAAEHLGDDFDVFVTGGDAALVKEMLPGARFVPDLIFIGLAIACPIP